MEGQDIIVIGLQPWDIDIGSNCKNIALEMARHNRVLYVNNPVDTNTLLTRKSDPKVAKRLAIAKGTAPAIENIRENLWVLYPRTSIVSVNWLKWRTAFNRINKLNNRRFSDEIRWAIGELGFSSYHLFNDNSIFLGRHQRENLHPQKYIYYIRDNLSQVSYWKYHGSLLEPLIIADADAVVTNSEYYRQYAQAYNPHSYMVGQGCDLTDFDPEADYERPSDMESLEGPIIGYVGYLSHRRLDITLLIELASCRPTWQFVLVGPEDEVFKKSALHQLGNVVFLGSKPEPLIPTYVHYFDVCLNPQVINEITIGNYPRKIDEYLAMGKPVVASATQAMEYFGEHVYLGSTAAEYERCIADALENTAPDRRQARIRMARQHTWQNSVKNIYKAINVV